MYSPKAIPRFFFPLVITKKNIYIFGDRTFACMQLDNILESEEMRTWSFHFFPFLRESIFRWKFPMEVESYTRLIKLKICEEKDFQHPNYLVFIKVFSRLHLFDFLLVGKLYLFLEKRKRESEKGNSEAK